MRLSEKAKKLNKIRFFRYRGQQCVVNEIDLDKKCFEGCCTYIHGVLCCIININLSDREKQNTLHRLIKMNKMGCWLMEERLKNKLAYLYGMADKYDKLNQKTNNKYQWRLNGICEHIEALESLRDGIIGEWDRAYQEDLKESEVQDGSII